MISIDEMVLELSETLRSLFLLNPSVTVIITVSPVRHWKDGSGENNNMLVICSITF
jgi:hypothetical protein